MKSKYSGSDWLQGTLDCMDRERLSDLGVTVADVLGQVYRGIYHIQKAVLHKRVDWSNPYYISVVIYGGLYSFDDSHLTELLVLCFDNLLRLEINPRSPRYLELQFHRRETREPDANLSKRLPSIDQMVSKIRDELSLEESAE